MKYQRVTTHLAETMSKLDVDKAMRDDYAKCILADPQILANIVKVIVPEFREYSIKDIIPCIGETIVSLTVPEKLCIKIESDGTEDVDIEDGKINCIITKDLSRFGRDHIDTGYYLERYLPRMNIRYIAIRRWNRYKRFKRITILIFQIKF